MSWRSATNNWEEKDLTQPRGSMDVYLLRISDQTRHRLGALPATLSEHYPPASRTITRHFSKGNPATAG